MLASARGPYVTSLVLITHHPDTTRIFPPTSDTWAELPWSAGYRVLMTSTTSRGNHLAEEQQQRTSLPQLASPPQGPQSFSYSVSRSLVLFPILLDTGHFTFQNQDKQMQPTVLVLLWQQDSGSTRCPRTLPDGIWLSQHSPLRLQPPYAWQRSRGAATPQLKAERAQPHHKVYSQQQQLKAAVQSSAFGFPAPVQGVLC